MYPNITAAFSISKETKNYTILGIEGCDKKTMEEFFAYIASPKENAVEVCSRFFGLPNYQQIETVL